MKLNDLIASIVSTAVILIVLGLFFTGLHRVNADSPVTVSGPDVIQYQPVTNARGNGRVFLIRDSTAARPKIANTLDLLIEHGCGTPQVTAPRYGSLIVVCPSEVTGLE